MKLGIIGFGNMGSAICDGLLYKNVLNSKDIYAHSRNREKLKEECDSRHINQTSKIDDLVKNVDVIIISTPARIFKDILYEIKDLTKNKILISVCSGVYYDEIKNELGDLHFIGTIPSTTIRFAEGIVIADNNNSLSNDEIDTFNELFKNVALVKFVDKEKMDIASTISGCGPSFVAMFIEALGDAGCKYGLSREESYEIASQMLIGSGTSYLKSKKHPGILKDEVASPKGTTIRGIIKLEECGFRNAIIKAIEEISDR